MIATEKLERLTEIKEEILALLREAETLVRGTKEENRARAYWTAQIRIALDDDHGYMARGSCTLQSTIDSLAEYEYGDNDVPGSAS